MSLAYGLNVQQKDDPFVGLSQRAVQSITEASVPGKFFVDAMPWLKYVPEWVPGAGFQKKAKAWRKLQQDFREVPYKAALKDIVRHLLLLFPTLKLTTATVVRKSEAILCIQMP